MLVTPVCFFEGTLLPAAAAATPGLYVSPVNTRSIIKSFPVLNTDTVPRQLTVHLVPSGGTASATNMVVKAEIVGPGRTFYVHVGDVLEPGDFITAFGDAANVLTGRASGVKVS